MRAELARTHLLYGEWLRRANRRVDARTELNVAFEQFSAMGMKSFAERTRRELLATGATVHKRTVEARDDLTAQEAQVARLARDGLSNPEIGAQLFISARTVEWHLAKVFSKLGISSRRQPVRLSPNTSGSPRARRASALEQFTTAEAADSGSAPQRSLLHQDRSPNAVSPGSTSGTRWRGHTQMGFAVADVRADPGVDQDQDFDGRDRATVGRLLRYRDPLKRSQPMRSDIVPGGIVPGLRAARPHEDHSQAQRAARRRPADPHARARPLLPEGAPAAPASSPAFYPQIAVAYTQIATIATDDHHTIQEFRASVGAQWPFLSDPERTVQQDLDIQEYTDPEHDPMIPHTLVLKPGLVVHSIYNGYWFWGRPVGRGPPPRPARRDARDPAGLGSQHARASRGLGRRRPLSIPRLEQVESGAVRGRA